MLGALSVQTIKREINRETIPSAPRGLQAVLVKNRAVIAQTLGHDGTDALVDKLAKELVGTRSASDPKAVTQAAQSVRAALARLSSAAAAPSVVAKGEEPKRIYLKDYTAPTYLVSKVDLTFDIADAASTTVTAKSRFTRNGKSDVIELAGNPSLELVSLSIDGRTLDASEYQRSGHGLIIPNAPKDFELTVVTRIAPRGNSSAMGLYEAGGQLISQCEPDGFSRMTFAPDRPDVMSVYTTTVIADRATFPALLSNGNELKRGELAGGRHFVTFHDPFPKPSYLFALVAGRFDELVDTFVTKSGREVRLEIYSDPGDREKTRWAMQCLKSAMKWDEEKNGLECDLDRYAIVVTNVFNFGAMENKGLNVFNASAALADPRIATDADYSSIDRIIAHEYAHNWTGNRVTMREPLQLTLKEGLTVFRDQEYGATRNGRAMTRINSVRTVVTDQFAQDAGPQAHAIRPESYISPENLYTSTVYRKGAEVIRMLHTMVGPEGFRRGMDEYFRRYDGKAVTTEDFVDAIASVNGFDQTQFLRWYSQVGTPTVKADGVYDAKQKTYTLTLEQKPGRDGGEPLHIPVRFALLGAAGDLPLRLRGSAEKEQTTEAVLELKEKRQTFVFEGVEERPVPSVLRDFSAPVKLEMQQPTADLEVQLARDTDAFNRFAASQQLATSLLMDMVAAHQKGESLVESTAAGVLRYVEALRNVLNDATLDGSFKAQLLSVPPAITLAQRMKVRDYDAIESARDTLYAAVGKGLAKELNAAYAKVNDETQAYEYTREQVAGRALKNAALLFLSAAKATGAHDTAVAQVKAADNMTDRYAALAALVLDAPEHADSRKALRRFYADFENEPLALDRWFSLQAAVDRPGTLDRVKALVQHSKFDRKVPNRVRALVGAFAGNYRQFHAPDGSGYAFVADQVIAQQSLNGSLAAKLAQPLSDFRHFDEKRAALMRSQLERIAAVPNLAREVFEVVSNALARK